MFHIMSSSFRQNTSLESSIFARHMGHSFNVLKRHPATHFLHRHMCLHGKSMTCFVDSSHTMQRFLLSSASCGAESTIPANRSLEEPAAISAVGVSISLAKGDRLNEEKLIDSVLVGIAFWHGPRIVKSLMPLHSSLSSPLSSRPPLPPGEGSDFVAQGTNISSSLISSANMCLDCPSLIEGAMVLNDGIGGSDALINPDPPRGKALPHGRSVYLQRLPRHFWLPFHPMLGGDCLQVHLHKVR